MATYSLKEPNQKILNGRDPEYGLGKVRDMLSKYNVNPSGVYLASLSEILVETNKPLVSKAIEELMEVCTVKEVASQKSSI